MAQNIDFLFNERLTSAPLNKRFLDIVGPGILRGYRLAKGTSNFSISLLRDGAKDSCAITPSGAKVEEDTDLMNVLTIEANTATAGLPRIDGIYLVYQHGNRDATASYIVVKGDNNNTMPVNPNPNTHLLLGWVQVFPNTTPLTNTGIFTQTKGFSRLEVAGDAAFHGNAAFDKPVTFKGPVTFESGAVGVSEAESARVFYDVLPSPFIAAPGQADFTLPSVYAVGKNALFVYVNGELLPMSRVIETSDTSFRLTNPLAGGESVFVMWYKQLTAFTPKTHDHNDIYYQKYEVTNRLVRTASDYFNGLNGRTIVHNLGHRNYDVISVVPLEKTSTLGNVSVEIYDNDIRVFNDGSYRGRFTVSYQIRNALDYTPTPEHLGEYSVFSEDFDTLSQVFKTTKYKRKDGTVYMTSRLSQPNADNRFTLATVEYNNSDATRVIRTEVWAFSYDKEGRVTAKVLQRITY